MNVLLKTKLYIPPVRFGIVPRPRLTRRLGESLRHRLTLVSAPAGFGKTTLLSEWIGGCGHPFAWLSLDEGDNDPMRFLNYIVAALQSIDADIGRGITSLLGSPDIPPMEALVTILINDLAGISKPTLLVLDDYHVIQNQAVQDVLTFLIDHQPPALHLFLLTRQDPPLPLPRLRARGQVLEVHADDLRFSEEETAHFLNAHLDTAPGEAVVSALHIRTEGWVAGLQLAALALRGRTDITGFVERFSGSHPYVFDYLLDEVLRQQPETVRSFLQQTAVLERLNAALCDEVTGRGDSQQLLIWLERANLFLVPLDSEREWYRYYQLFADSLRTELAPDQKKVLHARAAGWFAAHGALREAIGHYLAAGLTDEAAALIGRASHDLFQSGEFLTLVGWMDALPDELVLADSRLVTIKAWTLFLTGRYDEGAMLVQAINQKLFSPQTSPADIDPVSLGRLRLLQAYLQRLESGTISIPYVRQAVELLGEEDEPFSMIAMVMLANEQTLSNPSAAIDTFRRVVRIAQRQTNQLLEVAALTDLLAVLDMQGQRREAEAITREFLAKNVSPQGSLHGRRFALSTGPILIMAGYLAYAAGHLQAAEQDIAEGVDFCRQLSLQMLVPQGLRLKAVVLSARVESRAALEVAGEARRLAVAVHDDLLEAMCAATEADIFLKLGQIEDAKLQLQILQSLPWPPSNPYYAPAYFTLIRLQIAQKQIQEAHSHLAALSAWAEKLGHAGLLITIRILQAQAAACLRDHPSACLWLRQAIEIAAPQDYLRHFLDADASVIDLLPEMRPAAPAFVDSLLASLPKTKPAQPLLDALTERELEVLRLIADGLTNQQIAERLVTAVSTVKKHINHIFNKLQARDRTQAVDRARELGLL